MKNFEAIANTVFVPLLARIHISRKFPDLFYDRKALELEKYLPRHAEKGSFEYTDLASAARYIIMDEMVADFIKRNSPCHVISLGAGLESAYFRLTERPGTGRALFYEVDLPEVIDARRKVYGENPGEKLISGDMFAMEWAGEIENRTLPTVLIVSGVFQYFREEDILKLIAGLTEIFPGQELIFDATSTKGLKFTNWFIKRTGNKNALMTFGIDDSRQFAEKAGAQLLEERLFFPEVRKKLGKRASLISRLCMENSDRGKKAIVLRLRLAH